MLSSDLIVIARDPGTSPVADKILSGCQRSRKATASHGPASIHRSELVFICRSCKRIYAHTRRDAEKGCEQLPTRKGWNASEGKFIDLSHFISVNSCRREVCKGISVTNRG